jgi:hypothetical protein
MSVHDTGLPVVAGAGEGSRRIERAATCGESDDVIIADGVSSVSALSVASSNPNSSDASGCR